MAAMEAAARLADVEMLVGQHLQLEDEPLQLAVSFWPERNPGDVFVFEVIDDFGANRVSNDRELFEVGFGSHPAFPLDPGHRLRLVLTNPVEFDVADRDGWPSLEEVRRAVRAGRSTTVYSDPSRPDLEARLGG